MSHLTAGSPCPYCAKKGKNNLMIYTGRDRDRSGGKQYQRILKCQGCSFEALEDQVRNY